MTARGYFAVDEKNRHLNTSVSEQEEEFHEPGRESDVFETIKRDIVEMLVPAPCCEGLIFRERLTDGECLIA